MVPRPSPAGVSVIVPARNAAGTIGTTIASLVGDAAAILEVVVVDDGSGDDTATIASQAGKRHSLPVRIIPGDQRGAGAARNLGMRAARSDLLFFIDADDELVEGGLVALRDRMAADPAAGIAVGAYVRRVKSRPDKVCRPGAYGSRPIENVRRYLTDAVRAIAVGSALVRKSAAGGARFAEGLVYEEDTCFWVMALAHARVVTTRAVVLVYNVSLVRSDERFASSPKRNYLDACRSFRRLVTDGTVDPKPIRVRRKLIALKTARVCYQRGDFESAARFIGLVGLSELPMLRRWQVLRYVARIAVTRRLPARLARAICRLPLLGTVGPTETGEHELVRVTVNR
jgi:glycosyltransferase involved in cell wall biosynthesis